MMERLHLICRKHHPCRQLCLQRPSLDDKLKILILRWIKWIHRHSAQCDEDSSPESISDTINWLYWNGDLDNPTDSENDWEADNEADMELDNGIEDSETLEQQNVSPAPNVPGLIRPKRGSKKTIEKALITVNIMETRRNMGIKKR